VADTVTDVFSNNNRHSLLPFVNWLYLLSLSLKIHDMKILKHVTDIVQNIRCLKQLQVNSVTHAFFQFLDNMVTENHKLMNRNENDPG